MASAVTALCEFGQHVAAIGGWANDPGAAANTCQWLVGRGTVGSTVNCGWAATNQVQQAAAIKLAPGGPGS